MEIGAEPQNATPEKAAPVWEAAFLSALAECGVVTYAAKAAGIDRKTAYRRQEAVPGFAEAWGEAIEEAADLLEEAAIKRGRDGIIEVVVGKDGEIHENTKYSDTLLIFLLKGARPEKYRERFDTKVSGSVDLNAIISDAHTAAMRGADE